MVRHQAHHALDTLVRGHGGHTVLHDFLHRHRPGCLAIARKCINDFAFGNETKNCVPTRHHESANILYAEPARRALDIGFRTYCCDVGALPPQNAFDGHSHLHGGPAAYRVDLRGSAGLATAIGAHAMTPFSPMKSISISYRREAVSQHRDQHRDRGTDQSLANRCVTGSGHSRRFDRGPLTSGLPRLTDIFRTGRHVSNVPFPDLSATRPEVWVEIPR